MLVSPLLRSLLNTYNLCHPSNAKPSSLASAFLSFGPFLWVHVKNGPEYLSRGTTLIFIPDEIGLVFTYLVFLLSVTFRESMLMFASASSNSNTFFKLFIPSAFLIWSFRVHIWLPNPFVSFAYRCWFVLVHFPQTFYIDSILWLNQTHWLIIICFSFADVTRYLFKKEDI